MKHCRHYSFLFDPDELRDMGAKCAVGVDISGPLATTPCMPGAKGLCAVRSDYSQEEIDAEFRADAEATARLIKAVAAVPANGNSGVVECPNCGARLHWHRNSNGHVWGRCETEGCAAWIS